MWVWSEPARRHRQELLRSAEPDAGRRGGMDADLDMHGALASAPRESFGLCHAAECHLSEADRGAERDFLPSRTTASFGSPATLVLDASVDWH